MATVSVKSSGVKEAASGSVTWVETSTAGVNTFIIDASVNTAKLTLRGEDDIVVINGSSDEYSVKVSSNTVTLKSLAENENGKFQTITIKIPATTKTNTAISETLRFLDGDVVLASTYKAGITLGGQKLTTKALELVATVITDSGIALDHFSGDAAISGSTGVTGGSTTTTSGSSFTLTTGTDNITGAAGNDSINGVLQAAGASGSTVAPGDVVTGGTGTDTLTISVAGELGANYTLSAVSTSGVEKVLLSNFDTHTTNSNTVDASLMDGVTTLGLSASSAEGDTTFSNVKASVGAEMRNGAADLTLSYVSTVLAGTADTQNVTVATVTAGTFTANGAETIAVTTETSGSTLTNVASDTLTKVTVAGNQALTLTTAVTANTIDASTLSGALTVTAGANAAQKITGGTGNDVIDMSTQLGSGDTVAGGTGTDTLKASVGNATAQVGTAVSKGVLYNVSGFEVIDIASTHDSATLDLTGVTGVTNAVAAANVKTVTATGDTANTAAEVITFTLNGTTYTTASVSFTSTTAATDAAAASAALATKINTISGFTAVDGTGSLTVTSTTGEAVELAITAGSAATATYAVSNYNDVTFSNLAAGTAVDIYSGDAVTASLADASGTADALSINLKTVSGDKGFNHSVGTVTANNIETINLSANGMTNFKVTTVGALTGNAATKLNITGDSDVTISAFTGSTALATIDGSTSTGDLSLAAAPAAKDQSIKTGSGNDTIAMGAYLTNADTIDGGANSASDSIGTVGVDTVTATVTGLTATTGALSIANVERVNLLNAGAAVINAAGVTGATEIAFSEDAGASTLTLSNLASGVAVGLGLNGTADADTVLGTITASLASATGTADSLTFNLNDTTDGDVNTATLKTTGIETVNLAYSTTATALAGLTVTATDLTASKIVVTGSDADTDNVVTLSSLNAATTTIDASAFKGKIIASTTATGAVTVSATGTIAQNITTGAGADTITLAGNMSTMVQTIAGGTGNDILNVTLDNAASDFTSVSAIETINITVGANKQAGFNNGTKDDGLNIATTVNVLGGDSLSSFTVGTAGVVDKATATKTINASTFAGAIDLTVAAGGMNSFATIKGGALTTDTVRTTVSTAETGAKIASMTGVETLVVTSTDNNAASSALDLTNVTGLVTVDAQFTNANAADIITLSNLADAVNIKITSTKTADNLVVDLVNKSAATNSLNVELTAVTDANGVVNLDVAGVETLNITNKDAGGVTVLLDGVTATSGSTTAVTVAGTGATTLTSMSTSIKSVNASSATGALTIAAADRTSAAMTITGGDAGDSIAMKHASDVLTGGAGTDTLVVSYTAILGGIQVDLSATDVITSIDGGSNAAVQTGFESINLSAFAGFGSVITGSSGANTITGTSLGDNITGGEGADIITGGAGNDAIDLTETTATADNVIFSGVTSALNGTDTITGFTVANDTLDVGVLNNANVGTAITLDTLAALAVQGTSIVVANTKTHVIGNVTNAANIDTAAEMVTALTDGGLLDAIDVADSGTAYLIVSGLDLTTTSYVYGVTMDANAGMGGGDSVVLIGTITTDSTTLTTANLV